MAKILVVDDDFITAGLLYSFLTDIQHKAEMARTSAQAIEIGRWFEPDILISDWRLNNGETGLAVAEALRNVIPGLKVVFITGGSVEEVAERVKHLCAIEIMHKPLELDDVSSVVDRAIPHV